MLLKTISLALRLDLSHQAYKANVDMDTLSLIDLGFFTTESEASPKHVGLFLICNKPKFSKASFIDSLFEQLKTFDKPQPPFNQVLGLSLLRMPYWKHIESIDVSEHVFLHKLQRPGSRAQLEDLVGYLHGPKLDRKKPLWEFHLIDGLSSKQFAVYLKMHHSYADGISMFRFLTNSLSVHRDVVDYTPVWAIDHRGFNPDVDGMGFLTRRWKKQLRRLEMTRGLLRLGKQLAQERFRYTDNAVTVPFTTRDSSPLTGEVSKGRQIATSHVAMALINKIRECSGTTVNQVAVSCVETALHRYLAELDCSLDEPLTIQMPVNLREDGDERLGNKMGILPVDLAVQAEDPCERLQENKQQLQSVREQLAAVSAESIESYTILLNCFAQFTEMFKLSATMPLLGNTLVSNIPGGSETLYMGGATVKEMYTISALPPSNHLNITMYSYAGCLYFGLVATTELPNITQLADYICDAFSELDQALSAGKKPKKPPQPTERRLAS